MATTCCLPPGTGRWARQHRYRKRALAKRAIFLRHLVVELTADDDALQTGRRVGALGVDLDARIGEVRNLGIALG